MTIENESDWLNRYCEMFSIQVDDQNGSTKQSSSSREVLNRSTNSKGITGHAARKAVRRKRYAGCYPSRGNNGERNSDTNHRKTPTDQTFKMAEEISNSKDHGLEYGLEHIPPHLVNTVRLVLNGITANKFVERINNKECGKEDVPRYLYDTVSLVLDEIAEEREEFTTDFAKPVTEFTVFDKRARAISDDIKNGLV